MEYQIVLPPDLDVSAEAFATSWNADPECRAAGQARLGQPAAQQYDLGAVVELVLIPLAVSISANAFYDLLKAKLLAQGVRKRTRLIEQQQPDGSHLLVVTIDEE